MTPEQFRKSWLYTMSNVCHGPIKKPVYMIQEFDQMVKELQKDPIEDFFRGFTEKDKKFFDKKYGKAIPI